MEQCEYVFEERQEAREMDERCEWGLGETETERGQQRWMRSVNGFCGRERERGQQRWMSSVMNWVLGERDSTREIDEKCE
jgi:hypothetical protein